MSVTANNVQDRNGKILDILIAKEKEGFKYGEVKKFLAEVAKKMATSVSTVSTLYYTNVKGKFDSTINEEMSAATEMNTVTPKIDSKDNIENIFTINSKEVRVISEEGNKYYVAKDVHESIEVDRTSPLSKEGIKKEFKHYIPVKSAFGYVKTTVYKPEGLKEFLKLVMDKHTNKTIKEKAEVFYNHVEQFLNGTLNHPNKDISHNEKELKSPDNNTTNIISFEEESKQRKLNKPNYKVNELIEVQVAHIAHYGVLVETLDEFGMQGLIHLSDVRYGYVSDLELYFEVGDKLKAMVRKYDKENNRLNLTTKELKLPLKTKKIEAIKKEKDEEVPENDELAQELKKVKEKLRFDESEQVLKEEITVEEESVSSHSGKNIVISGEKEMEKPANAHPISGPSNLLIEGDREVQRIISILNSKVGAISPQAREKLLTMINEKGIVDFTILMMEVIPDFKADLGLMLLNEIEQKSSEYL